MRKTRNRTPNTKRFQKTLDTVADTRSGGAVLKTAQFYRKVTSPDAYVPTTVQRRLVRSVDGASDLSKRQLRRALGGAKSVGGKLSTALRLRRVDTSSDLSALSDADVRELGRALRVGSDDARAVIGRLDEGGLQAVGSADVSLATRLRTLEELRHVDGVTANRIVRRVDDFEGQRRERYLRTVRAADATEKRLLADADDATVEAVVDADLDASQRVAAVRRVDGDDLDSIDSDTGDSIAVRLAATDGGRDDDSLADVLAESDLDRETLEDIGQKLDDADLSPRAKTNVKDVLGRDPKTATFVDEASESQLRAVFGSDELSPGEMRTVARRYDGVDDDELRGTFRRLVDDDDPDVRESWYRAVSSPELDDDAVERTLKRVEEIEESGHQLSEFHRPTKLNDKYIQKQLEEGADDPEGPHKENSVVIDYETGEGQVVYRLWDSEHPDSSKFGGWTTTGRVIHGAEGYDDLEEDLAAPSKFNYDSIARVEIESGTSVRVSTAGGSFDEPGGSTQIQLRDRVPTDNWDELDSLNEADDIGF